MNLKTLAIGICLGCAGLLTLWGHRSLLDGIDGWTLEQLRAEDTEYATGYSNQAFRAISPGQTERETISVLGRPLLESWSYGRSNEKADVIIFDETEHMTPSSHAANPEVKRLVGRSKSDVVNVLGMPMVRTLVYSRSMHGGSYRVRAVEFRGSSVVRTIHSYYWD